MAETVKSYRVLRDGMRVGDSVRDFGDYMPEAAEFENLRSLLNSNVIEEVYVEKKAIDEWRVEQDKRDARRAEAIAGGDVYDPDDELEEIDEEPPTDAPAEKTVVKRKVAGKKKKATVKVKENSNGKRLEERSV